MKTERVALASIVLVLITVGVLLKSQKEGRAPPRPLDRVETPVATESLASLEGMAPATPSPERLQESVALEVAPAEEFEGPVTATAQITRGDGTTMDLRAIDGEFVRVPVEANEALGIRLALHNVDPTRPIQIDADFGGTLEGRIGPLAINPIAGSGEIAFRFAVGSHQGRYPVFITQGRRQEVLEFYVGPEPPQGQAGPPRSVNGDQPAPALRENG